MSTFQTTLFKVLESNAVLVVIDGYEVESICDDGEDAEGNPLLRADFDEDRVWYFADQTLAVTDGEAKAKTAVTAWDDEVHEVRLSLSVKVPLTSEAML